MSHFTVGVLVKDNGETVEELLAPYQENNMGDCPEEYLEFEEIDEEEHNYYLNEFEEKGKNNYKSFEDFMKNYGYKKNEETGKYGYYENPNARWDWYEIGGRWSGKLITKNGETVDFAKLKDIDWEAMKKRAIKSAEEAWDSNPQGAIRYFEGIHKDDARESFIERRSNFETYAVITPDGEWHSKGEMGWFGCSSESKEEDKNWRYSFYDTFIANSDQELTLYIIDCHI